MSVPPGEQTQNPQALIITNKEFHFIYSFFSVLSCSFATIFFSNLLSCNFYSILHLFLICPVSFFFIYFSFVPSLSSSFISNLSRLFLLHLFLICPVSFFLIYFSFVPSLPSSFILSLSLPPFSSSYSSFLYSHFTFLSHLLSTLLLFHSISFSSSLQCCQQLCDRFRFRVRSQCLVIIKSRGWRKKSNRGQEREVRTFSLQICMQNVSQVDWTLSLYCCPPSLHIVLIQHFSLCGFYVCLLFYPALRLYRSVFINICICLFVCLIRYQPYNSPFCLSLSNQRAGWLFFLCLPV